MFQLLASVFSCKGVFLPGAVQMRLLCLKVSGGATHCPAQGGDSIVEPYFVVYFRGCGSQFDTPGCLKVFEI